MTSTATLTDVDCEELRDIAVRFLVDLAKQGRAGAPTSLFHRNHVQPAVMAAEGAGWTDIHAAADREYGQWLIDNAA